MPFISTFDGPKGWLCNLKDSLNINLSGIGHLEFSIRFDNCSNILVYIFVYPHFLIRFLANQVTNIKHQNPYFPKAYTGIVFSPGIYWVPCYFILYPSYIRNRFCRFPSTRMLFENPIFFICISQNTIPIQIMYHTVRREYMLPKSAFICEIEFGIELFSSYVIAENI